MKKKQGIIQIEEKKKTDLLERHPYTPDGDT